MESKVSKRLAETIAPELCEHIYAPRLEREFAAGFGPMTYFNYEAHLIGLSGVDVGGRMHIARSRNDLGAALDRLRARDAVLDLVDALLSVRRSALDGALRHADVVMPGYTHLQPAQPVTYGFYLAADPAPPAAHAPPLAAPYPPVH